MPIKIILFAVTVLLFYGHDTNGHLIENHFRREKRNVIQNINSQLFKSMSISLEAVAPNTITSSTEAPNPVTHLKYVHVQNI